MEQISSVIASRFTTYLNKDQRWCNIFQYVLQILMEKWISLTVMGILAGSLGYEKEYMLFLLVFMPLRSCCGGFHMKTYIGCLACSCLLVGSVLVISGMVPECSNVWKIVFIGIIPLIPMNRMAPVLHINRPMKKKEIDGCRRKMIRLTGILISLMIIFGACNKIRTAMLFSETIWVVFIFMILGEVDYRTAVRKQARER